MTTKKNQWNLITFPLFLISVLAVIQFVKAASSHSDANANRGGVDERTSIQTQRPATVLPVYMTQDRLTLAVLTLLLGGWLAIAFTFPIVSRSGFILMNKCKLHDSEGECQRNIHAKMLSNSSVNLWAMIVIASQELFCDRDSFAGSTFFSLGLTSA